MSTASRLLFPLSILSGACGEGDLPGNYFDLELSGAENLCTGGGADHSESHQYRLVYDGNDITVAIGDSVWATGTTEGCRGDYTSIAWSSLREGYEIQWQIVGTARVDAEGGAGCIEDSGVDWQGTETFIVTTSFHPDVPSGCTYTLDATGRFATKIE